MTNYSPSKKHLREVFLFYFNSKISVAAAYRELCKIYKSYITLGMIWYWFRRFRAGYLSTKNKSHGGKSKFEDDELKALLEKNSYRNQKDLARIQRVSQMTISRRLRKMGMVQNLVGAWAPHELKPKDVGYCLSTCKELLYKYKK